MAERKLQFTYNVPIKEAVTSGKDFMIKGVAINETTTRNGVRYIGEELSKAAPSLKGRPILKDHENSVDNIVGRVTYSVYDPIDHCVMFEGKILDSKMKEMISDGRICSVSIGAMVGSMEYDEVDESAPVIPRGIDFVEISLVAVPADPNAGFAMAMCESFAADRKDKFKAIAKDVVENVYNESNLSVAEPKLTIAKTEQEVVQSIQDTKVKEATQMEELETIKKALAEQTQLVEKMKSEKLAEQKAAEAAEKAKLAESVVAKEAEIVKLREELAKATEVKTSLKGTTAESKSAEDPLNGLNFGISESGKGYEMSRDLSTLDSKTFPRLTRAGF